MLNKSLTAVQISSKSTSAVVASGTSNTKWLRPRERFLAEMMTSSHHLQDTLVAQESVLTSKTPLIKMVLSAITTCSSWVIMESLGIVKLLVYPSRELPIRTSPMSISSCLTRMVIDPTSLIEVVNIGTLSEFQVV